MMTDPIADMLTRIRNASEVEKPYVEMSATKLKVALAKVLLEEGFVLGYRTGKYYELEAEKGPKPKEFREVQTLGEPHVVLQVFLKYGPDGEKVIRHIQRYSKPGRRVYQGYKDVKRVLDGLGIAVLSTSRGGDVRPPGPPRQGRRRDPVHGVVTDRPWTAAVPAALVGEHKSGRDGRGPRNRPKNEAPTRDGIRPLPAKPRRNRRCRVSDGCRCRSRPG